MLVLLTGGAAGRHAASACCRNSIVKTDGKWRAMKRVNVAPLTTWRCGAGTWEPERGRSLDLRDGGTGSGVLLMCGEAFFAVRNGLAQAARADCKVVEGRTILRRRASKFRNDGCSHHHRTAVPHVEYRPCVASSLLQPSLLRSHLPRQRLPRPVGRATARHTSVVARQPPRLIALNAQPLAGRQRIRAARPPASARATALRSTVRPAASALPARMTTTARAATALPVRRPTTGSRSALPRVAGSTRTP